MEKLFRKGAVGALLDEYERTVLELQSCITNVTDTRLATIVDADTTDENCRSIQTILTHVVHSGYGYAVYIQNSRGDSSTRPEKKSHPAVQGYIEDLDEMFRFTAHVFKDITDDELEQGDDSRKIQTGWGQRYDIEQLMEHAIVHVMRHRRQIEKFNLAI
jgi:uncharacterized damage-inducible protein DinB